MILITVAEWIYVSGKLIEKTVSNHEFVRFSSLIEFFEESPKA